MILKPGMTVYELTEQMRKAGVIGAGKLGKAVEIVSEIFQDKDFTVFLSISGPLVPSGLRQVFVDLIKNEMVDVIVTNGANLVHDLIESMGRSHYMGVEDVDDEELFEKGINRAYDIFIENQVFIELENYVTELLDKIPEDNRQNVSINQLLHDIGTQVKDPDSILFNASEKKVPIFCPGLLDSMLGIPLWMYSKRKRLEINPIRDFELISKIVYEAEKTGALILGGGTPKHHTQYVNTLRGGLDAAVQISSATPVDGSLSGATLQESISWGKLKGERKDMTCTVWGDITIIFPVLIAAVLQKIHKI
jgi:deoxyhypusine synthase